MVLLDILQFNYYVDNEIVRNDMKNFAEMLGQTFEQYKKIWNEYLKLRKYCEDADFKIPFQLLESDNCNINTIITSDVSQVSNENTEVILCENVPNSASSSLSSYVNVQSESDKSTQKQEDKLLRSPILTKKHGKQNSFNANDPVLISQKKNMAHSPSFMDEDVSVLCDTTKEDMYNDTEEKENSLIDETSDQIECTPISKMSNKLRVSKLYNVDTTLLQNGKKLRQSTLVMLPDKQFVNFKDDTVYNKSKCLKSRVSAERNEKRNKSAPLEEEIIQRSPSKSTKSQFKMRSYQLKRKFMDGKANDNSDIFTDKGSSETKLSMSEMNKFKHDQYPSTTYMNKQKINSCNNSIKKSNSTSNSHAFSNAENIPVPVQELKKEIITQMKEKEIKREIITQKEENTCSGLPDRKLNASSSQNDETYFDIEEQVKKFNCDKNVLEGIKNDESKQTMLSNSPPVKKRQISKSDIFPDKEDVCYDKVPRKKSEREKLNGITCWECKQYYEGLGLTEEEIQVKKNQCSRHRSFFPQRPDTPEGFWNHLFPDTLSSTYAERSAGTRITLPRK